MFQKLWARFALIIGLVLLCWGIVSVYPLKKGIDLAGGVDLVYELDYSKLSASEDRGQMANRVIETLKRRIDPNGVKNLTWRAIAGGNRIEIQMPAAGQETAKAREAYRQAEQALAATNLRVQEINTALARDPQQRQATFDQIAPPGTPRRERLEKLAAVYDTREKLVAEAQELANQGKIPGAEQMALLEKARAEYESALAEVLKTNVDMTQIGELLEASDNPRNVEARQALAKLPQEHPQQKELIEKLVKAYDYLRLNRGAGFDDPADLQRMLRGQGVLDFRIAVEESPENVDLIREARQQLKEVGPVKAQVRDGKWFEIDPKNGADLAGQRGLVTQQWGTGFYILLYTNPDRALTHNPPFGTWKLTNAQVGTDPRNGQIVVNFSFDSQGALFFGVMTQNNIGRPMAILLDDRALSAPNIHTAITEGSGVITFGSANRPAEAVRKEAETLVRMLEAGSLPAALNPDPVSVQNVGSDLGEDNINAGLRSGIYAVIAVMAFMMVYYTLTGTFANIAVMINLLMTVAAMAMLGATFTLPGIAGIVLTLGMAVDANVLINERIREEVHRGASLWMAVRQGYDKVFWTIFDANLTTSLTAIVLIAVGSEEVKGFGVTLLIGLIVHMFTALFVTRTLMIAAIKWGIMRKIDDHSVAEYLREIFTCTWLRQGRWPFMRVITVTNIDWIGKRHIFWGISAIITSAGIIAFVTRGSDKYDTEFNGGTQLTFQLRKATPLEEVRKRVSTELSVEMAADAKRASGSKAAELEQMSRDMEAARLVPIGTDQKQYQLVTTITAIDQRRELKERLARKLGDLLDIEQRLAYHGSDTDSKATYEQLHAANLVFPVNNTSLEKVVPGVSAAELAQNDLSLFKGGVAVVLDKITPPQTLDELTKRLGRMRQAPDFAREAQFRDMKLIPVRYAGNGPGSPVESAVMVVADQDISYSPEANDDVWGRKLATVEWNLARQALTQESSWRGETTFDSQVAKSAQTQAIISIIVSLALIVIYVWIRFGGFRYGVGAILALIHDAIVALAATVLSGVLVKEARPLADALLVSDFKINLTMIAAYLTIIGYSVNDTIVIFDRIRENRGRATGPLSAKLVNDSINQCFGRTIWTTFTVFIVVLIMYIWGGEGVRGFSFAMLIGVFTGAYSTLAIAAPALLNVRERLKAAPVRLPTVDEAHELPSPKP